MKNSKIIDKFRGSKGYIITTQRDWKYTMYLSVHDIFFTTVYLKRESK